MFSNLLVLLKDYSEDALSRVSALFCRKRDMTDDHKDDLYEESAPGPGKGPKPGSVEPKTPIDGTHHEEVDPESPIKGPKPGTTDDGGSTDESFDTPE